MAHHLPADPTVDFHVCAPESDLLPPDPPFCPGLGACGVALRTDELTDVRSLLSSVWSESIMTFLSRFRRRQVSAHAVDTVVQQLHSLAKSVDIRADKREDFAKALFATVAGTVPENFVREAFSFDEAARMEKRLMYAGYVIDILMDCRD